MKVIFAGTPEFAAQALAAIIAAGFNVPLVLTQPDRPSGRGMKLTPSAVKQVALQHNIPVAQPISLRLNGKYPEQAEEARSRITSAQADVMVVAAYGLILPADVLSLPKHGCINIHASLLPRWRGAAPIHRAIEAGDAQTGITLMQMDAGLDTGDMLTVESTPILPTHTTALLHDELAHMGARMVVNYLQRLQAGQAPKPVATAHRGHHIRRKNQQSRRHK
jgi:methionyl-tRNA formyltransferase